VNKQSFVKELKIKVDDKEVKNLQEQLDKIYFDTIKSAMGDIKGSSKEEIEKLKELKEMIGELNEDNKPRDNNLIRNLVKDKLSSTLESLSDNLKDFFTDTFNEAKERIFDMASYDLENSMFSNSTARNQTLKYGLTNPAENYALTQSMSELGMNSEEDLMYMNENQRDKFAERMGYWTSKYQELANKDFFATVQNFALEWNEFKTEFQLDFIEFFIQNKDTIQTVMNVGLQFMESTLNILSDILNFLQISRSDSQKNAASMEVIRNYSNNATSNKVTINNTLNPASQVLTDKSMLEQAGRLSYSQIIEALRE